MVERLEYFETKVQSPRPDHPAMVYLISIVFYGTETTLRAMSNGKEIARRANSRQSTVQDEEKSNPRPRFPNRTRGTLRSSFVSKTMRNGDCRSNGAKWAQANCLPGHPPNEVGTSRVSPNSQILKPTLAHPAILSNLASVLHRWDCYILR